MKRQLNVLLLVFAAANLFLVNNTCAQDLHPTIYTVDDIIEKASVLVGQTVTVKGKVQHICQQTGRKLFLETADGKNTFRFNAGVEIDKFNENVLDSTVVATGIVSEQRLSLEDISKQEASLIQAQKTITVADHCTSEAKANGENTATTPLQRIQALKDKLKRQIENGKNSYLSFYSINNTNSYSILK
jgi:hypothetical protein